MVKGMNRLHIIGRKKYRLLADNVKDIIWIIDAENLRFSYISPSVQRMRGYTPQEAMALSLEETLPPESLAMAEAVLMEQLEKEANGAADPDRSITLELENYRKDGTTFWTDFRFRYP